MDRLFVIAAVVIIVILVILLIWGSSRGSDNRFPVARSNQSGSQGARQSATSSRNYQIVLGELQQPPKQQRIKVEAPRKTVQAPAVAAIEVKDIADLFAIKKNYERDLGLSEKELNLRAQKYNDKHFKKQEYNIPSHPKFNIDEFNAAQSKTKASVKRIYGLGSGRDLVSQIKRDQTKLVLKKEKERSRNKASQGLTGLKARNPAKRKAPSVRRNVLRV